MSYESFRKAVYAMGKYNTEKDHYDTPANDLMLGKLVQELAKIWDDECTISRKTEGLQRLEFFRELFSFRFNSFVSKTVSESQKEIKHTKKVVLPEKSDIRRLQYFFVMAYLRHSMTTTPQHGVFSWRELYCSFKFSTEDEPEKLKNLN